MYITVIQITIMKFYSRAQELETLHTVQQQAQTQSRMTFIIGRRRVGKTKLIIEAFKQNVVYFFVSRKAEPLLCAEFITQLETALNIKVLGEFTRFTELFAYILELSKTTAFTLAIDEFQDFYIVNPHIYAEMQNLWDRNKDQTQLNLVLSGSIYSLMHKIFENAKEPLYGRADRKMILKGFNIKTLQQIFNDYQADMRARNLLAFYTISGGIAKYVEIMAENQAFNLRTIVNLVLADSSVFITEGKDVLIEELGKEYTTYFSILALIASSKTSRSEMESILNKTIGGYLERLESTFSIIKPIKPIFSKPNSKVQKYVIEDNFLNFWFRFIYKYQSAIEIGNYQYVKEIILTDFNTYSGRFLEKYFIEKLKSSQQYNIIGNYWERGNKNEIDIVAVNERHKNALIAEVKLNKKRIDRHQLQKKSENLVQKHLHGFKITYVTWSLEDMLTDLP